MLNPKPTKPRSRDTGCSQVSAAAPKSKAVSPISAAAVMEAAWASRALRAFRAGFRGLGSGFRVQGLGFRVQGLGLLGFL